MPPTDTQTDSPLGIGAECMALCVSALLAVIAFWWLVAREGYAPLLALGATDSEAWLVAWTVSAETLACLLPSLIIAAMCWWLRSPRAARRIFIAWCSAVFVYEALDLQIYRAFGRHVAELARFAFLPGATQIAGGLGHWLWLLAGTAACAAIAMAALHWAARRAVRALSPRMSRDFQRVIFGVVLVLLVAGIAIPCFAAPFYTHVALREALRAQLIWAPPVRRSDDVRFHDPSWVALDQRLRRSYERLFPLVYTPHGTIITPTPGVTRPSVLLVVLESFRADSLTNERMPRLFAWAERGLIAKAHYAGSTFSEAGMFALLYGRSPLLYHAVLDAHEPPSWCALAHTFGMTCAYYSGQPKVWMRMEEFLNPSVVDQFVHDDNGTWPDWDHTALDHAVSAINGSGARPTFATVYLMSTHFEYQYPSRYARHMPVLEDAKWPKTDLIRLNISNRAALTNRYLNSLAFSDDLVADAIGRLDAAHTVVVVTGDHGESLGDDGRFGHAYSFADAITRVPLAIVGPGIPAGTLDTPTLHADVLRTLVHALGGTASGPSQAQDLLSRPITRDGLLLAHCSFDHDTADALLVSGDRRIRLTLGLRKPELTIQGPENELGRPSDTYALSELQVAALVRTFESQLDSLWQTAPR